MRRGLTMKLLTATFALGASGIGLAAGAQASPKPEGATPYILVASHGLQVITEAGPTCSKVYLSTDFVHFHAITPAIPTRHGYATTCGWYDASFVSPTDGWMVGLNGGGSPSVLEHTTDGGVTWSLQHPQSAEGSAGDVVTFTSPQVGWSELMSAGANLGLLQHTTDGGASWTTVHPTRQSGCWWVPDVFSTPSIGFESRGLRSAWRTENGGVSWSVLRLPRPKSVAPSTTGFYETPVFQGLNGTLPVIYLAPKQVIIAFDVTANGGQSWRSAAVAILHHTRIALAPHQPTTGCLSANTTAPLPVLSASTPGYWWILDPGAANASLVMSVALGPDGATPWGHASLGLPATAKVLELTLTAADDQHAYVGVGNGKEVVYESSDGGARWHQLPHGVP
jgi:Photosynthesis system II assembly factor YCF48